MPSPRQQSPHNNSDAGMPAAVASRCTANDEAACARQTEAPRKARDDEAAPGTRIPAATPSETLTNLLSPRAYRLLRVGEQDGDTLLQVAVVGDAVAQVCRPARNLLWRGFELLGGPD